MTQNGESGATRTSFKKTLDGQNMGRL